MSILRLSGVVREIGTFVILDQINASIALGDRIGLVGPNGGGKTTLLRIAAGLDEPDRGEVQRKRGLSLGMLAQEAHLDAAFMSAPDLRTAVRRGAAHLERVRRRRGSLLVASHDRAFLDATVSRIWELRDRRLTVFRGDYSAYHRQREERDERLRKDVEGQGEQIAREEELVQRYRSQRKFS